LNKVVWSTAKEDWGTPKDLFKRLDDKYCFDLDPAASHTNHLTLSYCTTEGSFIQRPHDDGGFFLLSSEDGLETSWQGRHVFLNPPYGRAIGAWVQKAAEESKGSAFVVALLPVRTGTRWWREWVVPYADIEYLPGRLRFSGSDNSAPFDSCIARYR
jgi:phage N-6-adenine-methyltransferase